MSLTKASIQITSLFPTWSRVIDILSKNSPIGSNLTKTTQLACSKHVQQATFHATSTKFWRHYLFILEIGSNLEQQETQLFHKQISHKGADTRNALHTLQSTACLPQLLLMHASSAMIHRFARGIRTHVVRKSIREDKTSIATLESTFETIANRLRKMLAYYSNLISISIIYIIY